MNKNHKQMDLNEETFNPKKKRKAIWPFVVLFILGVGILSYPFISDLYYRIDFNNQVNDFSESVKDLSQPEIENRMKLAKAYNESLINAPKGDPFSEEMLKKGQEEYARMLEVKEKIGFVEVPSANIKLPLYAGTSEIVLEKGGGHLEGTSLPIGGNSTHSVLTAHSGMPQAKLFTDLHQVRLGDKFYVHNIKEVLAYQVDQIEVIDPTDFSELLIKPGHDYISLLTCTPVGINSHRLVVRGHRIPYDAPVEERAIAEHRASFLYKYLFYGAAALALVLLLAIIGIYRRKQEYKKRLKAMVAEEKDLKRKHAKKKTTSEKAETPLSGVEKNRDRSTLEDSQEFQDGIE